MTTRNYNSPVPWASDAAYGAPPCSEHPIRGWLKIPQRVSEL